MTKLSVNVNKIATIRNARGGDVPNLQELSCLIEKWGADGITVHPRPDERHIRYEDVRLLRRDISTELNVEGNPTPEFMSLVEEVRPHQVTLVPDEPNQLTSNHGWDVLSYKDFLRTILRDLKAWGIRTSIFVGTDLEHISAAKSIDADRIELYTEPYARAYDADRLKAIEPFCIATDHAKSLGLGVNAGHDLSLKNIAYLHQEIPQIDEVSIGHALISEALVLGLPDTIARYQEALGNLRR